MQSADDFECSPYELHHTPNPCQVIVINEVFFLITNGPVFGFNRHCCSHLVLLISKAEAAFTVVILNENCSGGDWITPKSHETPIAKLEKSPFCLWAAPPHGRRCGPMWGGNCQYSQLNYNRCAVFLQTQDLRSPLRTVSICQFNSTRIKERAEFNFYRKDPGPLRCSRRGSGPRLRRLW